jgi:hypothetical protein
VQLTDRYHDDVKCVNDHFFEGEAIVKISNDSFTTEPQNTLSKEDEQAINDDVIEWCVSKIKSFESNNLNNGIECVIKKLSAIDWENANDPVIPEDFNPFAYLLLNTDVLQSDTAPYDHFIQFGHAERRKYQW